MQIPVPGRTLKKSAIFNDHSFPEFPEMAFGAIDDDGKSYFDATSYLHYIHKSDLSIEEFFNSYNAPISAMVKAYELDHDELCIADKDGRYLIDSSLCYIFIAFTNPDFWAYMMDRINDMFHHGFCISDTFLHGFARQRLPKEVLQAMIDDGV